MTMRRTAYCHFENFLNLYAKRKTFLIVLYAVSGRLYRPTIQKAGKGSPFLLFYQSSLK